MWSLVKQENGKEHVVVKAESIQDCVDIIKERFPEVYANLQEVNSPYIFRRVI